MAPGPPWESMILDINNSHKSLIELHVFKEEKKKIKHDIKIGGLCQAI